MDSLIETIAAWPAWVWLIGTILWALGAVLHMDRFATIYLTSNGARVQCTWWHVAWLLFWPIVTPLALPYLAIRRLRRWSRARRVEPPVYKRIALIRRMETLRDAARGVVKVPQCWKVSADMAVVLGYDPEHIEHDGMEHYLLGRPVLRCDDYWTRLDYVAIAPMPATKDQPRPTEKSAPYVLDTSREIRELRERVEKLEREVMNG